MPPLPDHSRILEIGTDNAFQRMAPERTTCLFAGIARPKDPAAPRFGWSAFWKIRSDLAQHRYALVALALGHLKVGPWNRHEPLTRNLGLLFRHLIRPASWGTYLTAWLARRHKVPIIAYDMVDTPLISTSNFFFFPFITRFFKRELPQNNWHVFLRANRRSGDVSNIRRQKFFQEAIVKIRPFPLHLGPAAYSFKEISPDQKKWDIFYVGDNPTTTVRTNGYKVLQRLADMGCKVHLPTAKISREEFSQCLEQSWLAWSPEGSGWECGRHYEAVIHGAVPVVNYPTIHRYKPLRDRLHAFYYGCEENHLQEVVIEALKDKKALLQMVHAAREHLRQWYTADKILQYVAENTLESAPK